MWWYIAFSIIFTIYAVDLVFLFVASLFAAVTEYFVPPLSTAATKAHKQQQKRTAAKQQQQQHIAKAQVESTKDVGSGKGDLSIVVDTRAHQVGPKLPMHDPIMLSNLAGRHLACFGVCRSCRMDCPTALADLTQLDSSSSNSSTLGGQLKHPFLTLAVFHQIKIMHSASARQAGGQGR